MPNENENLFENNDLKEQPHIVEDAPPTLDYDALEQLNPNERRDAIAKYSEKLSEFSAKEAEKKLAPVISEYESEKKYMEQIKAREELSRLPQFADFNEMLPKVESLSQKIPGGDNMSASELYTVAYLCAKGLENTADKKLEKSVDEQLSEIFGNEKLLKAFEEKRLQEYGEKSVLPKIGGGNGFSSAHVNLAQKPKTIDEAYRLSLDETI